MKRRNDDSELPMSTTRRVDDDVRSELEFHIEERAAELEASGMTRERALAEARELFGDRSLIEQQMRQIEKRRRHTHARTIRMREFSQDLTIGWRMLRKTPGFTIAAILTLALGIGANSAVFSIINQVILQPLPYEHADRLVKVVEAHEQGFGRLPWPTFVDVQERSRSFDAIASFGSAETTVLSSNNASRVRGAAVSRDFFAVLSAKPHLGRLTTAEDHQVGAVPVAVVSHEYWRDVLGSPASLENVRVKLDVDVNVVGVTAPGFAFPEGSQLWIPLELNEQNSSRTSHNWDVLGRLRDGVSIDDAERELSGLLSELRRVHYPNFDATGAVVQGLQATVTDGVVQPLFLLFAASTVLLLAACTNLASGLLARGTSRYGELAIRSALGAGRSRIIRQLLTESLLLAVLGALAGLVLATWMLRLFAGLAPASLQMADVHIDGWVIGFALLVAVVTAVLFGLYPALRLSEANAAHALREGARGTSSRQRLRAWNSLVAAEITLAVTLLAGSVVLIRSFGNVMSTDPGFDPTNVHTVMINLPGVNYPGDGTAVPRFHETLLERLRGVSGIEATGFVNRLPLEGSFPNGGVAIEGKPFASGDDANAYAIYRAVGGEYFKAMGIRLIAGRTFNAGDHAQAARVVVVNEHFAATEWPGQNPIGRRLRPAGMDGGEEPWSTVIGVVASERTDGLTSPFENTYYFDHRQRPSYRTRSVSFVVRSPMPAAQVASLLRETVADVDPLVPVEQGTMARMVERSVADRKFMMMLIGSFASIALLLSLVGIYSVVSYTVVQRTRELGVRLALGATPSNVLKLVVSSAMRGIIPGLLIGLLLSVASIRTLRSFVYGISAGDPVSLVIAIASLGSIAVAATLLPARRATKVDPLIAMRAE